MNSEIEKHKLQAILLENRKNHRAVYEKAVVVFREKAAAEAREQIERVLQGEVFRIAVQLPVPEDHTSDYDRILKMLELDMRDEITLEEHEVAQYVMDEWGWIRSFAANTGSYVS